MATFVLVHGAWHGGCCWQKVCPLLRAAGHTVYAPTLTGLGEREHLLRREVDLTTHIQDIVNVLHYEDLRDVVLVGHSYGGMVITGVAERASEQLAQLVYLDALVPHDGESAMLIVTPERAARHREQAQAAGDGWRMPRPTPGSVFGVTAEADLQWLLPRLTDHPLATWEQPVHCSNPRAAALPRTFILCTAGRTSLPARLKRLQTDARWRYRELSTGHDAMVTAPAELTTLLLEAATAVDGASRETT